MRIIQYSTDGEGYVTGLGDDGQMYDQISVAVARTKQGGIIYRAGWLRSKIMPPEETIKHVALNKEISEASPYGENKYGYSAEEQRKKEKQIEIFKDIVKKLPLEERA